MVFLVGVVLLFFTTAYILHICLGALPPHIPPTYTAIGRAALGRWGVIIIQAFAQADLFGGAVMGLIIGWEQFALLLPSSETLGFN